MNNQKTVRSWQESIIELSEAKLSRVLSETERYFIESRSGFLALEAIESKVMSLVGEALESYLNSESNENKLK